MDMLSGVIKSITSFTFYKTVAKQGFARTFMHIVFIAVLLTIGLTIFAQTHALKPFNDFIGWAAEEFPVLFVQGKTITTDAQEPYFINYTKTNLNFVFSTKQPFPAVNTLNPNTVVMENARMLFVGADDAVEEFTFDQMRDVPDTINATVDHDVIVKLKKVVNTWFMPVVVIGAFIFSVIGYCISAFFYSLVAFVISKIFKVTLGYFSLLSIAVYALTAMNLVVLAGLLIPVLNFPFRSLLLIMIAVIYLVGGIRANKKEEPNVA